MNDLYYIPNEFRRNIIVDRKSIDGVKVRTIDEYLLNFPESKKLVYEYIKKVDEPVKLSYVHKLFANQSTELHWYNRKSIQNDPIAKRVVEKLVYDAWTWKYGVRTVQNVIFDAKYLLVEDKRLIAKKCVDIYMQAQSTHVLSHKTTLRSFEHREKHNKYFEFRQRITKTFFEKTILKDVVFPNTIHMNYMYDFIELYDETSKMTLRCTLRESMDNDIRLIFPNSKGSRRKYTTNPRSIMSFARKYPDVNRMIDNIDMNSNEIINYHQTLRQLKIEYSSTYKQCVASLRHILEEYKEQTNYLDVHRLGMVFVHPHAVETTWFKFSGTTNRLSFYKSTYYAKNDKTTEDENDWLRHTTRTQTEKGFETTEQVAEYLIDLGFMNIFYTKREPIMTEYFLLAQGFIDHRYTMMFLMSTVCEGQFILEPYLEKENELKQDYEYLAVSEETTINRQPSDPDLNTEELFSRLEIEYQRNWPQEFHFTRKKRIKDLRKSSASFKRKNRKILALDA